MCFLCRVGVSAGGFRKLPADAARKPRFQCEVNRGATIVIEAKMALSRRIRVDHVCHAAHPEPFRDPALPDLSTQVRWLIPSIPYSMRGNILLEGFAVFGSSIVRAGA